METSLYRQIELSVIEFNSRLFSRVIEVVSKVTSLINRQ